jgi:hypothetical protein
MVRSDIRRANQVGKVPRHPFGHPACVYENEGGALLFDQVS